MAERYQVLGQNLLASDVVRQLAWQPPQPLIEEAVRAELARLGARPWQIDLTSAALTDALR
jgi:ribonuclease D